MNEPEQVLLVEKDDRIGRIVFNRPDRLNTFTPAMFTAYLRALDELEADDDIRVIIVKGAGRGFCAGWELQPGSDNRVERGFSEDLLDMDRVSDGTLRLWRSPKATIAQIQGFCIGGGLQFAMCCDLVYATDDAVIGQPEARSMGLVPDIGLWPLTINIRRTKELVMCGDNITGREAAEMGMINASRPADQLEEYVEWMARRLSSLDTETIALQKLAMNQLADLQGLTTMIGIGKSNDLIQHKQRGRAAFAETAKQDGIRAALRKRDDPFGGVGVAQSTAWEAFRRSTAATTEET
ncbi:hypothetical protein GIS00_08800 [Nakamurella sp. YIM 132087]|uniref:Enoyl-CoA hydratase/isomerase family protein n=1 Tax=Nakamurella alba TaxID=2665158 RepID=A0A7K1FIU8_9ACTN|nr:enoyl-CoA hydratase-related protein [Nakamurella alba]MTD14041.1 hypothetical protein [Nakamurella alba]